MKNNMSISTYLFATLLLLAITSGAASIVKTERLEEKFNGQDKINTIILKKLDTIESVLRNNCRK